MFWYQRISTKTECVRLKLIHAALITFREKLHDLLNFLVKAEYLKNKISQTQSAKH